MNELPVRIKMESGSIFSGILMLEDASRMSDLMNDGRMYLPVYVVQIEGQPAKMRMIQKRLIETVEEV